MMMADCVQCSLHGWKLDKQATILGFSKNDTDKLTHLLLLFVHNNSCPSPDVKHIHSKVVTCPRQGVSEGFRSWSANPLCLELDYFQNASFVLRSATVGGKFVSKFFPKTNHFPQQNLRDYIVTKPEDPAVTFLQCCKSTVFSSVNHDTSLREVTGERKKTCLNYIYTAQYFNDKHCSQAVYVHSFSHCLNLVISKLTRHTEFTWQSSRHDHTPSDNITVSVVMHYCCILLIISLLLCRGLHEDVQKERWTDDWRRNQGVSQTRSPSAWRAETQSTYSVLFMLSVVLVGLC